MNVSIDKGNEDENLPSMDALEINERDTIQPIPKYSGGEEEEDIPDMAEFDEIDNVVDNDPVSWLYAHELAKLNTILICLRNTKDAINKLNLILKWLQSIIINQRC